MSHQTPAQRAANRAFHRKEETKMGKRAPKPEPQEKEVPEKPKILRKGRKSQKQDTNLSKVALAVLVFVICGGAFVTLLDLFLRK